MPRWLVIFSRCGYLEIRVTVQARDEEDARIEAAQTIRIELGDGPRDVHDPRIAVVKLQRGGSVMHYGEFGGRVRELVELEVAWQARGNSMRVEDRLDNRSRVNGLVAELNGLNLCDMARGCNEPGCVFNRRQPRRDASPAASPAGANLSLVERRMERHKE